MKKVVNENNDREFKIFTVITLIAIVFCLSIAYIALSKQLKIKEEIKVKSSNWNIEIPLEGDTKPFTNTGGEGRITYETEQYDGTLLVKNLKVALKKPGDYAELTIPIKNNGDVDAYLSYVSGVNDDLKCTGTGESKQLDEIIVCGNNNVDTASVKYTIIYDDKVLTKGINGITDLSLRTGTIKNVKLRVEYLQSATKVPSNMVTVLLPEIAFFYQQIA